MANEIKEMRSTIARVVVCLLISCSNLAGCAHVPRLASAISLPTGSTESTIIPSSIQHGTAIHPAEVFEIVEATSFASEPPPLPSMASPAVAPLAPEPAPLEPAVPSLALKLAPISSTTVTPISSTIESKRPTPAQLPHASRFASQQETKPQDNDKPEPEAASPTSETQTRPAEPSPRRRSYLPQQIPISSISISVNSKAKGKVDARPENLEAVPAHEFPAVGAATAGELQWGMQVYSERIREQVPYQPLYFEEVNLERYGRTLGVFQPAVSTAHFFGTVPLLPYKMAVHHPTQAYYWRWPYPAGRPAPRVRESVPFNKRGAVVQGAAMVGAAFLLP